MKCVQSWVTAVEIYLESAIVYRRGEVELKAGENSFFISGLTSYVPASDMHIEFSGQVEHCRILNIGQRDRALDADDDQKALDEVNRSLELLDEQIGIYQAQQDAWKKNSDFTGRSTISLDESEAYIDKLSGRLLELFEKIQKLKAEEKDLRTRRVQLESALKKKKAAADNSVRVDVSVPTGGNCIFQLSYTESQARWSPYYEIWFKSIREPLHIHMRANIVQVTGEDWENAQVTLFYGNMNQSGNHPDLKPLYVDYPKASAVRSSTSPLPPPGAFLQAPGSAAEERAPSPQTISPAVYSTPVSAPVTARSIVSEDIFSKYALQGRYHLPSDIDGAVVDVLDFQIPAAYEYYAVPKLDPGVYLTARIYDVVQYQLLPCKARLFVENVYIGCTDISKKASEEMILSLGKDRRVEIERKTVKDFHSVSRFKNLQTRNLEYEIHVKNLKEEPVCLTVSDQLPVSKDREILVEAAELSCASVREDGRLSWNLNLMPGQLQTLRLAFSVSYPRAKTVHFTY